MHTAARWTRAVFRFRCAPQPLLIHWAGRSLVCSNEGCPACNIERPRARFYALADVGKSTDLIELPPTLIEACNVRAGISTPSEWVGQVFSVKRNKTRSEWQIKDHSFMAAPTLSIAELIEKVATLYRMNLTPGVKDWQDLRDALGAAHAPVLKKTLLDFEPVC